VDKRLHREPDPFDWAGDLAPAGRLTGLAADLGRPEWTVALVLVDDGTMAELNEGYREVPGVTDVLSFSYLLATGPNAPDLPAGQGYASCNLWLDTTQAAPENDGSPTVGEIVLAPAFVAERCRRREWSLEHEIPLLVVHGLLHLLGWEHVDTAQTEAMQSVEQNILAGGGLPHPLRERS
jgi:probable rRNA maturation factor